MEVITTDLQVSYRVDVCVNGVGWWPVASEIETIEDARRLLGDEQNENESGCGKYRIVKITETVVE